MLNDDQRSDGRVALADEDFGVCSLGCRQRLVVLLSRRHSANEPPATTEGLERKLEHLPMRWRPDDHRDELMATRGRRRRAKVSATKAELVHYLRERPRVGYSDAYLRFKAEEVQFERLATKVGWAVLGGVQRADHRAQLPANLAAVAAPEALAEVNAADQVRLRVAELEGEVLALTKTVGDLRAGSSGRAFGPHRRVGRDAGDLAASTSCRPDQDPGRAGAAAVRAR